MRRNETGILQKIIGKVFYMAPLALKLNTQPLIQHALVYFTFEDHHASLPLCHISMHESNRGELLAPNEPQTEKLRMRGKESMCSVSSAPSGKKDRKVHDGTNLCPHISAEHNVALFSLKCALRAWSAPQERKTLPWTNSGSHENHKLRQGDYCGLLRQDMHEQLHRQTAQATTSLL